MSNEWSLTPQGQPQGQGAQQPVRGRGLVWSGAILLVLSVVVGLVGVVGIARGVGGLASGMTSTWATPGSITGSFESGRSYTVYELTGMGSTATVQAADVSVTGQSGFSVPVSAMGITQTFESGGDSFTAVAQFTVPSTDSYVIQVTTPGATVAVGPGLDAFVGVGVWGLAILVAALLGMLGLILLVVGLVMRSSSRKAAAAGYTAVSSQAYRAAPVAEQPVSPQPVQALPPAGWYPDPSRPGGQRWWDGSRWTEHQA